VKRIDQKYEEYARFLAGESDIAEKQNLLERLENDPSEKKLVERLKAFWTDFSPQMDSADRVWQMTSQKLGFSEAKRAKTRKLNPILRYAVAATLLMSIGINSYFIISKWLNNPADMIEYTAKTGEVKEFVLPDGSKVWLNSESTLILPQKFEGDKRNVFLIGEAFFKVEKNPQKPFLVNTASITIKVLGTSFSVSNYLNDRDVTTSLVEGKVELQNKVVKGDDIVLKPSQEAIFTKSDGQITVHEKPDALVAPWREGSFRFYNTSLLSIAHQLERKFNCEFVFIDKDVESYRFTADFDNEGIDEILGLLNKAHSFDLKKVDRRYIISALNNKKESKK
jgi:transmembrane sensor